MSHKEGPSQDERYLLKKNEEDAWLADVNENFLKNKGAVVRPHFVLVAAQPGAGKSRLISKVTSEFNQKSQSYAHADIDAIRVRHPRINDIMAQAPFEMAILTNDASHDIRMRMLDVAKSIPMHVVYEATLSGINWLTNFVREYQQDGYQADIHAMAVPSRWSKLGIFQRFEQAVSENDPNKPPRMVGLDYHDGVYREFNVSLKKIIDECTPDLGRLYDMNQNPIWDYQGHTNDLVEAIEKERNRPKTSDEIEKFEERWDDTLSLFNNRSPILHEPDGYARDLAKTFEDARDFIIQSRTDAQAKLQLPRHRPKRFDR